MESVVFDLFRKRSWEPEVIREIQGAARGLTVRLKNFPCLRDKYTGDRKRISKDFGNEFLEAFHLAIGGAKQAHLRLAGGAKIVSTVRMRQLPAIDFELSGKPDENLTTFNSDIADVLIDAFKSIGSN
ncbi:MAG: hypothetical protein IJH04_05450 [Eggerthellaceae bacterium]|nr:hypothetical protein [Eggerthellaceae bacterium]